MLLIAYSGSVKAAFPSQDDVAGTYKVTATLDVQSDAPDDLKQLLKESFEFSIRPAWSEPNLYMNYITGFISPDDIQYGYTPGTGIMEVQNYVTVGGKNYCFNVTGSPFNGMKTGWGSNFKFTFSDDGNITIPDFSICTFNASSDAIESTYATFSNVQVVNASEGGGGGGEDNTDKYPAPGTFDGWYKYTCTDYNLINPEYAETCPQEIIFQITTNSGTISVLNFFFTSTNTDYDQSTGILTFNSRFATVNGVSLGIAPGGSWNGMSTDKLTFQIEEDGTTIIIPDFKVGILNGGPNGTFTDIASYGAGTVVPTEAPSQGGEEEVDFSQFAGKYTFTGTKTDYDISGAPIVSTGSVQPGAVLTFTIDDNGRISEFDGYIIDPELLKPGTMYNKGTLSDDGTQYSIEMDTYNGVKWVAAQIGDDGEPVDDTAYSILFGNGDPADDSYTQGSNAFTLTKNEDGTFDITNLSLILRYTVTTGSGDQKNTARYNKPMTTWTGLTFGQEEVNTYPTSEEIAGTYKFKANTFELNDPSMSVYFKDEFEFTIENTVDYMDNPVIKLSNFLYPGSSIGSGLTANQASYDEETGQLTFTGYTFNPGTGLLGIAPNGEWNGISAGTAYKLVAQFGADGSLTFPMFQIIKYSGATISSVVAVYDGIDVTRASAGGDDDEDIVANEDIIGTWQIPYIDYFNYTSQNPTPQTGTYQATLEGNTVTFSEIQEGREGEYHIVAKFIDAQTLEFNRAVVGLPATYALTQIPYVYTELPSSANGLLNFEEPFTATYNAETGTITFPQNSGLLYGNVNAVGQLAPGNEWRAAQDFNGDATQTKKGLDPVLTISNPKFSATGTTLNVSYDVELANIDIADDATWTAHVNEIAAGEEGNVVTATYTVPVTVEDGVASFSISGLSIGNHDFELTIDYVEGDLTVTSNKKALAGIAVGMLLEIQNVQAKTGEDYGTAQVTFEVLRTYNPVDNVTYKAVFTPFEAENDVATLADDTIETSDVVIADGLGTVTLSGLAAGSYDLNMMIYIYDEESDLVGQLYGVPRNVEFSVIAAPRSLTFVAEDLEVVEAEPETIGYAPMKVSLQSDVFEYAGFQFDVTLPKGVSISGAYGVITPMEFALYNESANVWRVIAYDAEGNGYTDQGVIATLSLSASFESLGLESNQYPYTFDNITISGVDFSSTTGKDIDNVQGSTGSLTVVLQQNPATAIDIESITLNAPSITDQTDDISEITEGQSLDITVSLLPGDTTDDASMIEWTVSPEDIDGIEFQYDDETGVWTMTTDGVSVDQDTDVTVTGTIAHEGAEDATCEFQLTIKSVLLGDSNSNDKVTVADVVNIANYIIQKMDQVVVFNYPNSDIILNEDGIQINDLQATIDIVFNRFNGNRTPAKSAKRYAGSINTNDRLVADNFTVTSGKETTIAVRLDNSYGYTTLSASAIIPQGMKVVGVTKGQRAAAHELMYNVMDGKVNIVLYSLASAEFTESNDALFNLIVTADEDVDNIKFEDIMASDRFYNSYTLFYDGGMNQSGTTGINGIDADEEGVRYFDVNGMEIPRPDKGIYIRVNKNGEVEKVVK